jgi:hypothetical protein
VQKKRYKSSAVPDPSKYREGASLYERVSSCTGDTVGWTCRPALYSSYRTRDHKLLTPGFCWKPESDREGFFIRINFYCLIITDEKKENCDRIGYKRLAFFLQDILISEQDYISIIVIDWGFKRLIVGVF